MKVAVRIMDTIRKEMLDTIESQGLLQRYLDTLVDKVRKQMESMGPPPLGYKYELSEPFFDYYPEEGKYTVKTYIKTVPIK